MFEVMAVAGAGNGGIAMRVLVTGAAGFIGAAVSAALLARGDAVIGVDNLNDYYAVALKNARLDRLAAQGGNRFAFEPIDFADRHALDAATLRWNSTAWFTSGRRRGCAIRSKIRTPMSSRTWSAIST